MSSCYGQPGGHGPQLFSRMMNDEPFDVDIDADDWRALVDRAKELLTVVTGERSGAEDES